MPVGTISSVMLLNSAGLGSPNGIASFIRNACNGSPLAGSLTPFGWPGIFNDLSDGMVSLTSQAAGMFALPLLGMVHSEGLEDLGFNPPSELDAQSAANGAVVNLLNASARGFSFHQLP